MAKQVRVVHSSAVVVSPELAKMLHRVQQLLNEGETSITIVKTSEVALGLQVRGQLEIIKRR